MNRLVDSLFPGARVFVPSLANESALLAEELALEPDRARDVTFTAVQFPGIDSIDYLGVHPKARQVAFFMSPAVRRALPDGRAVLLSLDYLGLARRLLEDERFDVAIAQLAPPDADGWCSPGLTSDFLPLVWARARRRVAHINPRMPRTRGSFRVHVSEIDVAVERDAALLEHRAAAPGDVERRIGKHVASLVRDGDVLQFGVGAVPTAVGAALSSRRRLRLHGGFVSHSLRTLWEAGALDREARITAGVVLGDADLREFAARLEQLWLTDVMQTHSASAITAASQGSRFVAVNGALEVDLFGQVNAERVGASLQAGAGGLPAFAHAALVSPAGRLVICVGASAKGGSISRIVPVLGDRSMCTLPRHLADAIVTEHGVAELRGLDIDARAEALIAIAAPEHRESLQSAWRQVRSAA